VSILVLAANLLMAGKQLLSLSLYLPSEKMNNGYFAGTNLGK